MKSLLSKFETYLVESKIIDRSTSVGGSFTWLSNGTIMRNLFIENVKKICAKYGFDEYVFPMIISGDEFKNITNNIKDFSKGVYWVDEDRLLRPSGETIIYPSFRNWIKTYRDLPIKVFQIGLSFRKGDARGIFRLRETDPFIEFHTAHSTRAEAEKQVEMNINCFKEILEFMGLPAIQTERPAWGNNPVAEKIIAFDTLVPNGETIHLNSVYSQMQVLSKHFDIKFYDKDNKKDFTYQTEFGFGPRMIFSTLFLCMDEKGLNIPPQIAPKQIVIIPIFGKKFEGDSNGYINELKLMLESASYRVMVDNSSKCSTGNKRYMYESQGIPLRIEVGQKEMENNMVTLISRETNESIQVPISSAVEHVKKMLEESTEKIKNRIKEQHFSKIIKNLEQKEEINSAIENGQVASFPLCCTEECCKTIEKLVKGEVIGYNKDSKQSTCVVCGQKTAHIAFQARHL